MASKVKTGHLILSFFKLISPLKLFIVRIVCKVG